MIRKINKQEGLINIPEGYPQQLDAEVMKYNNRYAVLMNDMTVEDEQGAEYRLDKGTLVKVTVECDEYYGKIYLKVHMSGVVENKIKDFIVYRKGRGATEQELRIEGIRLEDYANPTEVTTVFSGEKCLEYLETNFGVLEELDRECAELRKLDGSSDLEIGLFVAVISAIDIPGIMMFIKGLISSPLMALAGLGLCLLAASAFVHRVKKRAKCIQKWLETDEKTTRIVALIENGSADIKSLEDSPRLTTLTPLLCKGKTTSEPGIV